MDIPSERLRHMTIADRNRQNALQSTGPRSPEGLAKSSQNACKYGLSIQRHTVLPSESVADYNRLVDELTSIFQPQSPRESLAVDDLAQCRWAIQRIDAVEFQLLVSATEEDPLPNKLLLVQRYRSFWERRADRALRAFRNAATDRLREQQAASQQPIRQALQAVAEAKAETARIQLVRLQREQTQRERYWQEDDLYLRLRQSTQASSRSPAPVTATHSANVDSGNIPANPADSLKGA